MRVLWFGNASLYSSLNPYHGGGWVASLYNRVKERYFENIQISLAFNWIENVNDSHNGIKCYGVKTYQYSWLYYDKIQSNRKERLKEIVDLEHPDIIHVFGTEGGLGLVSEVTNIPVVLHLQGILSALWEGWLPQNVSWNELCRFNIHALLGKISLLHDIKREKEILRNCRYLMGRTNWDKNISEFMAPHAKYYYCGEMLRPDIYDSKKIWSEPHHQKKIIISIISNAIYKGNDTILRTALALKEYYGDEFEWRVYGVTDMSSFEERTKVKARDVNVVPMGIIDAKKLVDVVSEADLFVHPSNIENSPNSVCEAQVLGIPVISTNAGGVSSLIEDEVDGLLVAPRDVYALAAKITRLLRNPSEAQILSENGRKHALDRHNPKIIVDDLINIYEKIIKENI